MLARPLVLGHRGSPRTAQENTLASFLAARREGADGVELDVRLARDGTLLVCHDQRLDRLAGVAIDVERSGALAVRSVRLSGGGRVPTLDEVFDALRGAYVNVEIKREAGGPAPHALSHAVDDCIKRARRGRADTIVSSFDPHVLIALRARSPTVPRGLLLERDPARANRALSQLRAIAPDAIHPHHRTTTREQIALWHAAGFRVNAWTVNADADVKRMLAAGVDAIITDVPAAAAGIVSLGRGEFV